MIKMWKTSKSFMIGIDEVGRGALAGPVVVAAVVLPRKYRRFSNLKDSKKLSLIQRQRWFERLKKEKEIFYTLSRVYPSKIDKINITQAANLAATRAFFKLIKKQPLITPRNSLVLLDGGLYLNFNSNYLTKTIVKGDEKYDCIKLASIVAKVTRDRYLEKLHQLYPVYGFNKHKGYGTKEHLEAIYKYGPTAVHRLTFIRKYLRIKKSKKLKSKIQNPKS